MIAHVALTEPFCKQMRDILGERANEIASYMESGKNPDNRRESVHPLSVRMALDREIKRLRDMASVFQAQVQPEELENDN